ncbi:hypothetical protein ILT44_01925 [Microvirga sp. BT689]|uniref:hypothetical protein n=1 Tax=Microvirga arvi TaxID=2778731 RepID=UPI00194E06F8|nr:hypothetical protein [Microvirga arvi]MBM6578925.1 hypothetical protein [Microvirga arvi]
MFRFIVMYIAVVEALLFAFLGALYWLDGASAEVTSPLARFAAILCIVGVVPALVLVVLDRWLAVALLLTLAVLTLAVFGFAYL